MNIAMLGHKKIPSPEGGVETVVYELATSFVQKGHSVTAYNRHKLATQKASDCEGVRIVEVSTLQKRGIEAALYSLLATLRICFSDADIVHYHAEGPCVMIPLAKLFRKKVVVSIHGLDWKRAKWGGFASWYIKQGEKKAAKYADEIIVLSKPMQEYFMTEYNRKTALIPNGVGQTKFREPSLITSNYQLGKDDYLLYLGRIVPEKGLLLLIQAYSEIDTSKKLVIAGGSESDSAHHKEVIERAEKDPRIIMTGWVDGREKEELLSNALLFVLPSDIEGMAVSLLEAISYELPCLVSDIEENAQAHPGAITFQQGSVEDLREKIEAFLRGEHSVSDTTIDHLTWDAVADHTLEVYAKVLSTHE